MLKINRDDCIARSARLGRAASATAPTQPSPVKRTILQKADLPGTNLELIYATVEITAGFKAGRHSHPGVVMFQVVEGNSGSPRTASRRRFFMRANVHDPRPRRSQRGRRGRPVKISVVYAVEKGQPLASPAK